MMVVLHFSCNFEVVVGGDEHNIYLLCQLDQNLEPIFRREKEKLERISISLYNTLVKYISSL